jgi:histidinol-phosphatase (PHP family)
MPPTPLDYHMHTRYSEDGSDSPAAMASQAVKLGIPEIGFSEHWDVGPYEAKPFFFQPEPWFLEISRLRKKLDGQLIIRAGIEIAEPHLYARQAGEVLSRLPFDYVIGSVHWVGSNFMFDPQYFARNSADEIYTAYFLELEKMVDTADIDIVAHFDIPVRTAQPSLGYEPNRYEALIRRVLGKIIQRNLALDINTAGFRKPAQNLMPDPLIIQWYREMGGRHVTLGSDAHQVDQVGLHLERALEALNLAGLQSLTHYEQRQPRLIPLGGIA